MPRRQTAGVTDGIAYTWRGPVTDEEMVDLVESHGGAPAAGWWDRIRPHSLGWVTARRGDGLLVGFVNVAWDGGDHAFLIDTKTRGSEQRRGIGSEVVRRAALQAGRPAASGSTSTSIPSSGPSTSRPAASARPTPA